MAEFKTEYVDITVQLLHQHMDPIDLRNEVEAAIRDRLPVNMFEDDIRVYIDSHTGDCSQDYCGETPGGH